MPINTVDFRKKEKESKKEKEREKGRKEKKEEKEEKKTNILPMEVEKRIQSLVVSHLSGISFIYLFVCLTLYVLFICSQQVTGNRIEIRKNNFA